MDCDIEIITSAEQIMQKLSDDGDLRFGGENDLEDFEFAEDDELGFYQQGCEYLISELASQSLVFDNKIAALESEVKRMEGERDKFRKSWVCSIEELKKACKHADSLQAQLDEINNGPR
jgi:hypothetical protein